MTDVNTTAQPAVKPEQTSPQLTTLRENGKTLAKAWQGTEYGTPEFNNAKLAMLENEKAITVEIANINKAEADAKLSVERSKRIELRVAYKAAVLANAGKGANDTTAAAEQAAQDALDNQLLSKFATVAKTGDAKASGGGTKGAVSADIENLIIGWMREGKTATEAVKLAQEEPHNHSRGTAGSVRTQMVKDGKIDAEGKLTV